MSLLFLREMGGHVVSSLGVRIQTSHNKHNMGDISKGVANALCSPPNNKRKTFHSHISLFNLEILLEPVLSIYLQC
jgi:hypothetical protein